jgi:quercetin dioxygenase-like cupin family protein
VQGEVGSSVVKESAGSRPAPEIVRQDEMRWGPAPDAFPAGAQLCLLHGDPAAPGEMFSVRLRASERYVFAPHSHPHDEHITVISGRLALGNGPTLDRGSVTILEPGGYAFLPRDQFHYGWPAADDTVFQVEAVGPFAITYANPDDDPRSRSAAH